MPSARFWAGKKVFLTGHTGFKGGWLALWLERLGARVKGYALEPAAGHSLFALAKIGATTESVIADVRDGERLARELADFAPDIVLHLAAQPLVRLSYTEPVSTFETNVMGTVNLLEAVRRCPGVQAVVVVTSDKCYRNREWHWGYREDEPLGGHDPYSASKACTELVAQSWRLSFLGAGAQDGRRCAVATARAGNVIGGGDWAVDRLVPDVLRELAEGKEVTVRNPDAVRPWQHVIEPLAGYLVLAERLAGDSGFDVADAWNFGPRDEDARPVSWIVDHLIEAWPTGGSWTHDGAVQPHEATHLKLDCSRARALLGWHPRWSLAQALAEIVRWQSAWLAGEDMHRVSLETIARYEEST